MLSAFGSDETSVQLYSVIQNLGSPDTILSTMPPKFNPNKMKVVYLRYPSGGFPRGSSLVLSPKKVGVDITKAPSDWKDLRITGKQTIQNRQAQTEERWVTALRYYLLPYFQITTNAAPASCGEK